MIAMKTRLTTAFIFNLIDTFITLYVTQGGYVELNPVTRILLYSPFAFMLCKIILVSLALWWLWQNRTERLASVASWCAVGIYGAVMFHYLILFICGVMI